LDPGTAPALDRRPAGLSLNVRRRRRRRRRRRKRT